MDDFFLLEIVTLFSLSPFLLLISSPSLLILTDVPSFSFVVFTCAAGLGVTVAFTGASTRGLGGGGGAGFSTGGGVAGGVAGFTGSLFLHDASSIAASRLKATDVFLIGLCF